MAGHVSYKERAVNIRRLASMFGAFVLFSGCLHGQQVSSIIGAVVDPSGGIGPNAAVNLVAPERGV